MNRRKAIKILNADYYWDDWTNGEETISIPHSGKHWNLIHKACNKLGKAGKIYLESITNSILTSLFKQEIENEKIYETIDGCA